MTNITMLCANRPRLLKQALDSIGDLSDASVVIRDAGLNGEVKDVALAWSRRGHPRLVYDTLKIMGTGPARNEVIRVSEKVFGRGDYLYLSDDDVFFLRHDWLKRLIEAYEWMKNFHGYAVVGGYNHPYHQPVSRCEKGYEVYALATQSMLMSWDVFDNYGPFCDTPPGKVCQSEDADFCNKIRADGYKIGVISPPLLVNCGITNSFREKIVGWELVQKEAPLGVIVE